QMKDKATEKLSARLSAMEADALLEGVERPAREYEAFADTLVVANVSAELLQEEGIFGSAEFGRVQYAQRDDKTLVMVERSIESVYLQQLISRLERATESNIELRSSEFVGPQIGDELRDRGGLGMLTAFAL